MTGVQTCALPISVRVNDINKLGDIVKMFLNNPEKLQEMKQSALKIAKPAAARDIGNTIVNLGGEYGNRSLHTG